MARLDIFDALKLDHDRHRKLLKQLAQSAKGGEQAALFEKFRIEVTAHAAAEELSLYATMLGRSDLREEAQHSVAEHKEIEDMLDDLKEIAPDHAQWDEQFKALRKRYEHHIDEEEEEMFVSAAEELSDADEQRLLKIFQQRKPEEVERAVEES